MAIRLAPSVDPLAFANPADKERMFAGQMDEVQTWEMRELPAIGQPGRS